MCCIHDVILYNVILNHFGGVTVSLIFHYPTPSFKFMVGQCRILLIINSIDVLKQRQGKLIYGFMGTKRKTREPTSFIICDV